MAPCSLSSVILVSGSPKITNWFEKMVFTKWVRVLDRVSEGFSCLWECCKLQKCFVDLRRFRRLSTGVRVCRYRLNFSFFRSNFPFKAVEHNFSSSLYSASQKTQRRLWTNYSAELQFTAVLRAADEFKCFQLNQLGSFPSEEPADDRIK